MLFYETAPQAYASPWRLTQILFSSLSLKVHGEPKGSYDDLSGLLLSLLKSGSFWYRSSAAVGGDHLTIKWHGQDM